jgi:glycopeptide antibiotics resistance protein
MPAGSDAAVRLAGVAVGVALFPMVDRANTPRPWLALLLVATFISAALSTWSPFQLTAERQPFAWVPFLGYYGTNWFPAVSHVMELMLTYFPFGFLMVWTRAARSPELVSAALVAVAAWGIEYGQSWFVGRHPDITDIAFSVVGGIVGAWLGGRGVELFGRARTATVP